MSGPGDPNSYGFFGHGYWGRKVFWEKMPVQHRQLDTNGHLENLLKTWGDESESFLDQIGDLPRQREPYDVRARAGEGEWFYFTEAFTYEDDHWGKIVRLIGEKIYADMPNHDEDDIPTSDEDALVRWWGWWPYAPISKVARWWEGMWAEVPYKVMRVRTRSFDWPDTPYDAGTSQANEVWLSGGDLQIFFDYFADDVVWRDDWTNIGEGDGSATPDVALPYLPVRIDFNDTPGAPPPVWLVANAKLRVRLDLVIGGVDYDLYDVPDGTATETGNLYPAKVGTPTEIDTNDSFGTVNYQTGQIVIDMTTIDLSVSGQSIKAKWYVRGYYLQFHPPRIIDRLSRDFGFDNDKNDPEDVQRSTIANLTKYYGLKATQDSYRIRGEVSLFDVYVRALWFVCDDTLWNSLPPEHQFVYHGEHYTDIDPRYIHFDDIAADQEFWDPDTLAWQTLVDNAVMFADSSPDGHSIALGYGLDVAQGSYGYIAPAPHPSAGTLRDPAGVVSSTLLTAVEAATYGFQAGYRVVVRMMRCQEYAFNWSKGLFGLTEYDKSNGVVPAVDDPVFWIDDVDMVWTFKSAGPTTDEDIGEWTVIIGAGIDGDGNPYPGPTVGHGDIIAVDQPGKKFTLSGDHAGTIQIGETLSVIRSTGNNGLYTVVSTTLVGSDTEVVVAQIIPSAVVDGEMTWVDIAIRYYPAIDVGNCCYCKSYKVRVEIEPTVDAYAFYDTDKKLNEAIDRMKNKIAPPREAVAVLKTSIVPIHARVVDWSITKSWTLENVCNGNVVSEDLIGEFLSDDLSDVSAVDQVNDIFTINGDQRSALAVGDSLSIRGSTGNDGGYVVSSVELNANGDDTDVGVTAAIPSSVADGTLYPMPSQILMTVEQRGDMGAAQMQQMSVLDEVSAVVWTVTQGTGASDPDTWYNVVEDLDVLALIGNNSPVRIIAMDTGGITYGDVRFTFTVSKYSR